MENQTAVLLGPEMLTRGAVKWLREIFKLKIIDYELTERELIYFLQQNNSTKLIHGGNVITTAETVVACPLEWLIFIGKDPEPLVSHGAVDMCQKKKIPLFTTGGGIRAVIETTYEQVFEGTSLKARAAGREWPIPFNAKYIVAMETISVIGAGNIGKEVLLRLRGKCSQVMYAGGRGPKDDLRNRGIPYKIILEDAFRAHVVLVTLAHTPETEGMIAYKHLSQINPWGVLICNTRINVFNIMDLLRFASQRRDVRIIIDAAYNEIEHQYGKKVPVEIISLGINLTGHTAFKKPYTPEEYSQGLRKIITENNLA